MEAIAGVALELDAARPRRAGRRSLAVVADAPILDQDAAANYTGRRFSASMRYGLPVEDAVLGTVEEHPKTFEVPAAVATQDADELDNVLRFKPQAPRQARGFATKIAAVAAVSGLAFAAASALVPESNAAPSASDARVSHAVVADVTAPTGRDLVIERASVSSSFTKEDKLTSIMAASGGDVTKIATAGVLSEPLSTIRITSEYGFRNNPTGPGTMIHSGMDYGIQCGTPVKAAAAGIVVQSEWAGHSGQRVRVDHGNGLQTTYNHNSALKVSVGQKVERGQLVSLSGTTGNSTGCHLHFEVLVNGKTVNPRGWL
ncbi:hypothetical protein GCM10023166_30280 [Paeniglutamicibacter cryotolerans]